jgi:hypothetical protein
MNRVGADSHPVAGFYFAVLNHFKCYSRRLSYYVVSDDSRQKTKRHLRRTLVTLSITSNFTASVFGPLRETFILSFNIS